MAPDDDPTAPSGTDRLRDRRYPEGTPRVLIAEARLDLRAVLAQLFEAAGFHAFVSSDGWDALRLIDEQRPKLALISEALPLVDGRTLADMLHTDTQIEAPAVVLLTATDLAAPPTESIALHVPCTASPFRIVQRSLATLNDDAASDERAS